MLAISKFKINVEPELPSLGGEYSGIKRKLI
jgi:hypothetical protein